MTPPTGAVGAVGTGKGTLHIVGMNRKDGYEETKETA